MFPKKEFYFIRHGQTDENVTGVYTDRDIPINATGKKQAQDIESLIATLPIQSVCHSPLLRARQTKELITRRLKARHIEVPNLAECTIEIWDEMTPLGKQALQTEVPSVKTFMQRVSKGLAEALTHPGPILIVAHGGVHWAICNHINIPAHLWHVDNCVPVHFVPNQNGEWVYKRLTPALI